jgi:hypothetical protein
MTQLAPVVFLLDVDNTLLDNDRITADLKRHLDQGQNLSRRTAALPRGEPARSAGGSTDTDNRSGSCL